MSCHKNVIEFQKLGYSVWDVFEANTEHTPIPRSYKISSQKFFGKSLWMARWDIKLHFLSDDFVRIVLLVGNMYFDFLDRMAGVS